MEQLKIDFENKEKQYVTFKDVNTIVKHAKKEKQTDNSKIISSLRKSAQSCSNQAENINTEVSGNWTYRRQSFADSAQKKKDRLLEKAVALNRLADMWEANECPEILKGIRTASDFDAWYPRDLEPNDGWYKDEYPNLLKKALKVGLKSQLDNEPFKEAIKQLQIIELSPEQKRQRMLNEALKKVHAMNIPGFFPTPDDVIDQMIEYACIEDHHSILEPSAGIGSIVDRIKFNGFNCDISCIEQQYSLCEILKLKEYKASCIDILSITNATGNLVDRILMNPPFEKGQDIDHVMHCWSNFLKDGGRLVSIMSAGVKSNTNTKYVQFRDWVNLHGGEFIDLGQAFKKAFNSTGTSVIMLILNK